MDVAKENQRLVRVVWSSSIDATDGRAAGRIYDYRGQESLAKRWGHFSSPRWVMLGQEALLLISFGVIPFNQVGHRSLVIIDVEM